MSKDALAAFLHEMRTQHAERIDAMELPDGTHAFLRECAENGDVETLAFLLKLGYLMGLQHGYAAGRAGDAEPDGSGPSGPLQA